MPPSASRARSREARQQTIVRHVVAQGVATVAELTKLTGASVMTVHRDLDELARRGIVRKFHGGVSAQPSTVFESSSDFRLRTNTHVKELIADAALPFLEPGMSVMFDDSTTALFLARKLFEVGPLTVVTNYLPVIDLLKQTPDTHLIAIGGDYSPTHDSFLGISTQEAIEALTVDLVFLSTSAMTAQFTFHQEQEIVQVKRRMLAAGTRSVLLMDASKLARTGLHRLAPLSAFDHLVVDDGVDDAFVRDAGEQTDVVVAPSSSDRR